MAEPTDFEKEMADLAEQTGPVARSGSARRDQDKVRRMNAVRLRVAGLTYEQIAEQLNLSTDSAHDMVQRTLSRAENQHVETMRAIENERLDTAQSVIWNRVLQGDIKAIDAFLRISNQRVKINGLAAPTKLDISIGVRTEMEEALSRLESMVLTDIMDAEVIEELPAQPLHYTVDEEREDL